MIKLRVGTSKKTGRKYFCIVYVNKSLGIGDIFLTFDTEIVFKLSGKSYAELCSLADGDYPIGE